MHLLNFKYTLGNLTSLFLVGQMNLTEILSGANELPNRPTEK